MRTALLVMDMQLGIIGRADPDGRALAGAVDAVGAARAAGLPVVFVRVAFRPGFPEVSATNRAFSALRDSRGAAMTIDAPETQIHAELNVRPDEPVIVKKRISAFAGSDLEIVLRALEVRHLVLAGISTSGVVLSTVREAADRDYALTVLADACADVDPEVHRVLIEKIFPRQAEVATAAAWITGQAV